jgi:hypothetical protein
MNDNDDWVQVLANWIEDWGLKDEVVLEKGI